MYINAQYLLLISLLLFLSDACLIVYFLIYRRLAIVPMSRISLVSAVAATAILIAGSVQIIRKQDEMLANTAAPRGIFTCCMFVTLFLVWLIILLRSADRSAAKLFESLIAIAEAGAPNLNGNAIYVQKLTKLLYENLPIEDRLRVNPNELEYAAILIDVGQLGIPRQLREKYGKLTAEERQIMRKSPDIAENLLSSSSSFKRIAKWIRLSGERIDGSGRLGLTQKEIPYESRILAVACTYSAVTLSRTYKASRGCAEAMEELKIVAGTQLDAELVEAFINIPIEQLEEARDSVNRRMEEMRSLGVYKKETEDK
ncbi:MAG: hypothetical protein K6G83_16530 [Lachnospiraceae bacterium]|nr:hypothetical protein [Lachnospiraceae bacterium]